MSDAAGKVQIVLSVDKATYSQAMAEAQRQLDQYAGKAKSAGHATVSSMQASSAAIRELKNPLGDNTRAIERFITTLPGVGNALRAAFPLIGGIAFGAMIVEMGSKVVEFVKKANAMPQAIRDGFAALSLEQKTSIDSMNVLTDKLNEAHAAFEHKPGDATKTAIDEAKESADKFAAACVAANAKVEELLSKNSSGLLSALLLGKPMTGEEEDSFKEYQRKQNHNAYTLANAAPGSPEATAAQKAVQGTRSGYIADRERKLPFQEAQGGAVAADAEGVLTTLKNEAAAEVAATNNAAAQGQAAKDEVAKKAAEQAKKAAEQAKAAASLQVQGMVAGLNALKLQYNLSIKAEYDYWDARRNAFAAGSTAYNEIVAKQAELAVAGARSAHEAIAKFQETQKRDSSESVPDFMRGPDAWNKQQTAERTQGHIDTNQGFIDSAQNRAKDAEADIAERVGKSLTQFDAAVQLAKVHTDEYNTTLASLQTIEEIRETAAKNDPTPENQKALAVALKAIADYQTMRGIQVRKDNIGVNGESTSGLVGAEDALRDFVQASRDAATQMRDLVNNTLHGLNTQIITAMMGKRTDFRGVGSDMFKSIANSGLNRAEGGMLNALGLGKGKQLGTDANPMVVRMAGAVASGAKTVGSAVNSMAGGSLGKFGGFIGSMLKTFLPGFAGGGYLDGPSIVGEQGPELFIPGVSGTVIPNNKLTAGSAGDIHFHPGSIDARGATDPAAVEAAVQRGIRAAAPRIMAGSVHANREDMKRRPSRA